MINPSSIARLPMLYPRAQSLQIESIRALSLWLSMISLENRVSTFML